MDVQAGAVLALSDHFPIDFHARDHLCGVCGVSRFQLAGGDQLAQAAAHRLRGRIAEHASEFPVDAHDARWVQLGQHDRVGREIEQLVQVLGLPLPSRRFMVCASVSSSAELPRACSRRGKVALDDGGGVARDLADLEKKGTTPAATRRPLPAQARWPGRRRCRTRSARPATGSARSLAPHEQAIAARQGLVRDHDAHRLLGSEPDHQPVGTGHVRHLGRPCRQVARQAALVRVGEDDDFVARHARQVRLHRLCDRRAPSRWKMSASLCISAPGT